MQIQLNAKLQAYSRVPFYPDFIREAPKNNNVYVRRQGEWVELDISFLEALQDKLTGLDQESLYVVGFDDANGGLYFTTLDDGELDTPDEETNVEEELNIESTNIIMDK